MGGGFFFFCPSPNPLLSIQPKYKVLRNFYFYKKEGQLSKLYLTNVYGDPLHYSTQGRCDSIYTETYVKYSDLIDRN